MTLNITREYKKEFVEDTYNLATSFLKVKSTHFFIASHKWDRIYIELTEDIPDNYLSCFSMVSDNIKVKLPDVRTDKTMRELCELYPDKAGKIRKAYLQGTEYQEVISECLA